MIPGGRAVFPDASLMLASCLSAAVEKFEDSHHNLSPDFPSVDFPDSSHPFIKGISLSCGNTVEASRWLVHVELPAVWKEHEESRCVVLASVCGVAAPPLAEYKALV